MEIKDIRKSKRELEEEISKLMTKFTKETDANITFIEITGKSKCIYTDKINNYSVGIRCEV